MGQPLPIAALTCPICGNTLSQQGHSVACPARHSFDISREGYINLTLGAAPSKYDKVLFTSRRAIHEHGFFTPLVNAVTQILLEHRQGERLLVVDAGCGEGSLLNDLVSSSSLISGIGIDIAKEGVRMAAKKFKSPLWLCADLARMPIQDHSVDVILNILSPANYAEFSRVLRPGGLLVKAIPGADHLREMRRAINNSDESEYSNEDVLRLYGDRYESTESIEIKQTIPLDRNMASDLVRMTPLSWSTNIDTTAIASSITEATLHLTLLVSKV